MCDRIDSTNSNLIKTMVKLGELERKIQYYTIYEKSVDRLLEAHNVIYKMDEFEQVKGGKAVSYYYRVIKEILHREQSTSTDKLSNITLEELAKLVIDGTPIERDEKLDVKMKYYGRV